MFQVPDVQYATFLFLCTCFVQWNIGLCTSDGTTDDMCTNPFLNNIQSHLRLVGFNSNLGGYLEICRAGEWKNVSVVPGDWGRKDSAVVCKELGYLDALAAFNLEGQNLLLDAQSNWLHYDNVKCTGIEKRLSDCTGTLLLVNHADVQNMEQVFVLCNESPNNGAIRLVGSSKSNEGILEVYHPHRSYQWSTVCIDDWSDTAASVACRQMGFTYGRGVLYSFNNEARVLPRKRYNNYNCSGHERTLSECRYHGPYPYICYSQQYAGVICQEGKSQGSVVPLDLSLLVLAGGLLLFFVTLCALVLRCIVKRIKKKRASVSRRGLSNTYARNLSELNGYILQNSQIQNFIPPPSYEETIQNPQQLTPNTGTLSAEHSDTSSLSMEIVLQEEGANSSNIVCNEELTVGTFNVNGDEHDTCIDVV